MQMSHAKSEITKTKHQEQVCNVLEMHLMKTSRRIICPRCAEIKIVALIICLSLG